MAKKNDSVVRQALVEALTRLIGGGLLLVLGWGWHIIVNKQPFPSLTTFFKQHTRLSILLAEVVPWVITSAGILVLLWLIYELVRLRRLLRQEHFGNTVWSKIPGLRRSQKQMAREMFKRGHGVQLRLQYLPKTGDKTNAVALILTLHGYRILLDEGKVESKELEESLRQVGCTTYPMGGIRGVDVSRPPAPAPVVFMGPPPVDLERICGEANEKDQLVEEVELQNKSLFRLTGKGQKTAREMLRDLKSMVG